MDKFFFFCLLSCLHHLMHAQTIISSNTAFGTWTTKGSPYIIEKGVEVASGSTLTISPGVVVKFKEGASLKVYKGGGLRAIGKKDSMIVFTSNSLVPKPGDWESIFLSGTGSKVTLSYCRIEYATRGIDCDAWASGCSSGDNYSLIENCEIKHTKNIAISCYSSGSTYQGCIPIRSVGVCKPILKGNKVYLNDGKGIRISANSGYFSSGYTSPEVIGNEIYNNKSDAIEISNNAALSAKLFNNTIYGNLGNGVSIEGNLDSTKLDIQNNQIIANLNGIFIKDASNPSVLYNNFWNNKNSPISTKSLHQSNLLINPEFVNFALGDFQLKCTSPCIDAGSPESPSDADGSRADIGAHWFDHRQLTGLISGNFSKPICIGSAIILEANGGITYNWSGPKNFTFNGSKIAILNATKDMGGIYNVSIVDANQCTKNLSAKVIVETCTSASNITESDSVIIFPNPTRGTFNLKPGSFHGVVNLQMSDMLGKEVLRTQIDTRNIQEQVELNANFLSKGTYLVRIFNLNRMVVKKLIKE